MLVLIHTWANYKTADYVFPLMRWVTKTLYPSAPAPTPLSQCRRTCGHYFTGLPTLVYNVCLTILHLIQHTYLLRWTWLRTHTLTLSLLCISRSQLTDLQKIHCSLTQQHVQHLLLLLLLWCSSTFHQDSSKGLH